MGIFSFLSSKTGSENPPALTEPETRHNRRGRYNQNRFVSYYGRPVVRKAHWKWYIWFYFWIGGVTAGASAIASLTELFGDRQRYRSIIQAGRYISLAGLLISPVLLILDLGRPERFHHMLRILKLRSPLNLGTYILTTCGVLGGINTARQVVEDGLISKDSLPGKLALQLSNPVTQSLQGLSGLALGSYTGVVLSATATPLWSQSAAFLGPIFISTSFSNGAAAISLVRAVNGCDTSELDQLDGVEQIATLVELGLIISAAIKLKPEVRQVFAKSIYGKVFLGAVLQSLVVPFLLQLFASKTNRTLKILGSLLVLLGSLQLRYAIVEGGKITAQSSDAYHAITRGEARPGPESFDQTQVEPGRPASLEAE